MALKGQCVRYEWTLNSIIHDSEQVDDILDNNFAENLTEYSEHDLLHFALGRHDTDYVGSDKVWYQLELRRDECDDELEDVTGRDYFAVSEKLELAEESDEDGHKLTQKHRKEFDQFKERAIQVLKQALANAVVTDAESMGHEKGRRNRVLAATYTKRLHELGITVPSNEKLYEIGVMNGPGSS